MHRCNLFYKYIKTVNQLLIILAVSTSMMLSCRKNTEIILTDPPPSYNLLRQVQYLANGTTATANYTTGTIGSEGKFYRDSVLLELHFAADTAHDELYLQLSTGSMDENWVKRYPLMQRPVKAGESFMSYLYHEQQYSSRLYPGYLYPWQGSVTLTSYDAKRKLVSGSYQLTLSNIYDPVSGRHTEMCNIVLSGTFSNLKFAAVE